MNTENYKAVFEGTEYEKLEAIAEKDYNHWETVNANKGRKQCYNTFNSCMIGTLAEATVTKYAKEVYGVVKGSSIRNWGMSERTQSKSFYSKPDIEVVLPDYTFSIEVKGITAGQQKGQILPYHINKYNKEGVNAVVFVEVSYDRYQGIAHCEIYCKESPKDIAKDWPLHKNTYGKECFTAPEFI